MYETDAEEQSNPISVVHPVGLDVNSPREPSETLPGLTPTSFPSATTVPRAM